MECADWYFKKSDSHYVVKGRHYSNFYKYMYTVQSQAKV